MSLTVGKLKAELQGVPDDTPVHVDPDWMAIYTEANWAELVPADAEVNEDGIEFFAIG